MYKPVSVTAPVNIAVIKYWGKRDTALILPTNSSLSLTLSSLISSTSITQSTSDSLLLNGSPSPISKRIESVLRKIRGLANIEGHYVEIVSDNNFPTAAGLASSASGLAALAFALAKFYKLDISMTELSGIARLGSGSACRSLFGGFVEWEAGVREDGSDSLAKQIAPASHWPEMSAMICIVSDAKKETSSSSGMQTSVETSELMVSRVGVVVPRRIEAIKEAIMKKDFASFAEITMRESNQFHAICLDTYPPIFYLTDVSRRIIQLVTEFNRDGVKLAYTFDAGPNAVIYSVYADALDEFEKIVGKEFGVEEVSRVLRSGIGNGPEVVVE